MTEDKLTTEYIADISVQEYKETHLLSTKLAAIQQRTRNTVVTFALSCTYAMCKIPC